MALHAVKKDLLGSLKTFEKDQATNQADFRSWLTKLKIDIEAACLGYEWDPCAGFMGRTPVPPGHLRKSVCMKRAVATSLIVLATAVASGFQETKDWVKFESEPGLFSVLMPSAPRELKETTGSPQGPYTTSLYVSHLGNEMYIAGWVDYDRRFNFDAQKELELNRDNFVKGVNGKLRTTSDIAMGDYPGIEFTGTYQSSSFKSRVFIVGKRPYLLIASFPTGKDNPQNISRFLSSFVVTPKLK